MNSKDFYRYLNTVLSPAMKQVGFVKDKRSIPCWHTGTGERLLYLMVKTGKYPYQPYIGGDFSLYACLRDTDDPPPQAGDLDLDIFEYVDETLKQRILAQNRAVYGKIAALLISAVLFSILHFNIAQIVPSFICGIILGLLYFYTDSIFSCILAHIGYNSISYMMIMLPIYINHLK